MTYTITLTITRPAKDVTFLPQDQSFAQLHVARKAAAGWVREERSHTANTMTITTVWESKADYEAFEQANLTALEVARAARHKYFDDHGLTGTTTWIDE